MKIMQLQGLALSIWPTWVGFYLRTETVCLLNVVFKQKMAMDNVQKLNNCISIPLSQTFISYENNPLYKTPGYYLYHLQFLCLTDIIPSYASKSEAEIANQDFTSMYSQKTGTILVRLGLVYAIYSLCSSIL
jgi:hypothetical protein